MPLVVDASAISAIAFAEPSGDTIAAHIAHESLVAPTLIDYELANIAWKKIRRHPDQHVEIADGVSPAPEAAGKFQLLDSGKAGHVGSHGFGRCPHR